MKTLTLSGNLRKEIGKKNSAELRRTGFVPCNLYGNKENIHFFAPYNSFLKLVYNPDFFKVNIDIEGKNIEAVIQEIQFNPVSDKIEHVDFLALVPGKKVTVEVPLKLVGQSEGVKAGGKLIQKMRKLKIKAKSEDLKEVIELNIEGLQLGKSVYVRDIQEPTLQIINTPEIPVATVEVTRTLKSAEADAKKVDEKPKK